MHGGRRFISPWVHVCYFRVVCDTIVLQSPIREQGLFHLPFLFPFCLPFCIPLLLGLPFSLPFRFPLVYSILLVCVLLECGKQYKSAAQYLDP